MARPTHPRKEIEQALRFAEQRGWEVKVSHARALRRVVEKCVNLADRVDLN
tara:strand:- start:216 stop:368 length:153 start_codon:yes stop_codon:yes gene_type:complete